MLLFRADLLQKLAKESAAQFSYLDTLTKTEHVNLHDELPLLRIFFRFGNTKMDKTFFHYIKF